jgi:4-amino-4-deoxy-L-arabinose transferase-like glycosyltransferase
MDKVKMKNFIIGFKNWAKGHKLEFAILVLIIAISAFFRLYKITQYMTFLGDEGRDAMIVRNLLVHADPILVGPGTSVGNMYLGPLYYYFMAPGLLLSGFSPVGPAVQIAILGVITVGLVWYITKSWFGARGALVAAGLYAIAPTIIIYARSSWNPNIMPFFALLSIWAIWKIWQEEKYSWFWVLGISFAFVMQSHYLGLLLFPAIAIFWVLAIKKAWKDKAKRRRILKYSLISLGAFVILMSPLVVFDARHGWRNLGSMKEFFFERADMVAVKPLNILYKIPTVAQQITTRILAGRDIQTGKWFLMVLTIPFIIFVLVRQKLTTKVKSTIYFLLTFLTVALVGFGLYQQEIYDHYFGFLFPIPFILLGGLTEISFKANKKIGQAVIWAVVAYLVFINLKGSPLLGEPNGQMPRARNVAQKIIEESGGQTFNLAVIANQNYEDGYQYFLEKENAKVVEIDPQKYEETVAQQLFVVCELTRDKCQPTSNPKAQIANFGWSKIDAEWEEFGVILYKLVHNK